MRAGNVEVMIMLAPEEKPKLSTKPYLAATPQFKSGSSSPREFLERCLVDLTALEPKRISRSDRSNQCAAAAHALARGVSGNRGVGCRLPEREGGHERCAGAAAWRQDRGGDASIACEGLLRWRP